ncbi:hypothetical protein ACKGJN_08110 [Gillisia sp. Q332]|uniref:hypothetical protein n=1 Tax=Gillisia xinjiangensis TaxID=3384765 RepID=UPI0039189FD6
MEKVLIILALAISGLIQGQENYEQGMEQAFLLWEEGKNEEASALFEKVGSTEKENWLPNYYVALVNTTSAFKTLDFNKMNDLLSKAQTSLDIELGENPNNVELLVMQAMIHTAWIAFDPMSYGQKLSPSVIQLYAKAEAIAPNNPRLILSKARFEMGTAQFFGSDIKPICTQIERSVELFDNFKAETKYSPNWGKDQALAILNNCK